MNSLTRKRGFMLWHQRQSCISLLNQSKPCLLRPQASYWYSTSHTHHAEEYTSLQRTRNIGIIAHIDAVGSLKIFANTIANMSTGKDDDHRAYALLQWLHASNRRYGLIFINCLSAFSSQFTVLSRSGIFIAFNLAFFMSYYPLRSFVAILTVSFRCR